MPSDIESRSPFEWIADFGVTGKVFGQQIVLWLSGSQQASPLVQFQRRLGCGLVQFHSAGASLGFGVAAENGNASLL